MKSFLNTLLFVLLATAAFAQYETVTKTKRPSIPGTFLVDLGINRALNTVDSTWNQGLWGSRTVNVYYQYPIRFGRSKFSFNPGIGLSMERWKFTDGAMLIDTVELTGNNPSDPQLNRYELLSPRRPYGEGISISKSSLVTNYLEIPLEFRFDSKPEDIARSLNVAIGGRFGLRLNSFTKVKYKLDGETIRVKDKRGLGLNDFRYGVYTRVGIGGFSWFAFYNLSEMFEKGKGPHGRDINSLTVGISINGF